MKTIDAVSALCICIAPWLAAQQPATSAHDGQLTAAAQPAAQSAVDENPAAAALAPTPSQVTPAQSTPDESTPPQTRLLLKRDTEVKLRLEQELSSTTSKKGDEVRLTLVDDVVADGHIVVPRGTVLKSKVTRARPANESDDCTEINPGYVEFGMPKLTLANGTQAALDYETAEIRKYDDDRLSPGNVGAIVLGAPLWIPEAVIVGAVYGVIVLTHPQEFFNHKSTSPPSGCHGKLEDQTLEKGKLYTYYVLRNVRLPAAAFAAAAQE
jgi:hypothetical protein